MESKGAPTRHPRLPALVPPMYAARSGSVMVLHSACDMLTHTPCLSGSPKMAVSPGLAPLPAQYIGEKPAMLRDGRWAGSAPPTIPAIIINNFKATHAVLDPWDLPSRSLDVSDLASCTRKRGPSRFHLSGECDMTWAMTV